MNTKSLSNNVAVEPEWVWVDENNTKLTLDMIFLIY